MSQEQARLLLSYVRNIKVFVRAYELGSMSAAGRDQRVSAAVVSSRIIELEKHLGVRLFNRTTRKLTPTEHGEVFYTGAVKILEVIEEEADTVLAVLGGALLVTFLWFALFRVSLLAMAVTFVVAKLLSDAPLTFDLTAWWAAPTWITVPARL